MKRLLGYLLLAAIPGLLISSEAATADATSCPVSPESSLSAEHSAVLSLAEPSHAVPQSDSTVMVEDLEATSAEEPARAQPAQGAGKCPDNMVEVAGQYCTAVEQICLRYDGDPARDRCLEFREGSRCVGRQIPMHYCVDRYEYPNQRDDKPVVAVSFEQAAELCAAEGKRMCSANEWTLACEGPERLPYPYGHSRDKLACNIDKPYIVPDDQAYAKASTRAAEVARLDQSEPSGSRSSCVTPYGVHDMTGNVDEWVVNPEGEMNARPYDSGLKGGYWAPVRNRCRPMTVDHNRWHNGYQIGFRCCSDVPMPPPAERDAPAGGGSATPVLRGS
jgi:sulfatase modifying factor 1